MLRPAFFLAFSLALSTGCGGDSESFGSEPPPTVPLEDAAAGYAEAYCELVERCAGVLFELSFPNEDCDVITAKGFEQGGFAQIEEAVDAGRVVYHADKAQACFDSVANRACEELNERESPACEAALTGTVPQGGDCEIDAECEGSLICETNAACPGTCVRRYEAGEPCIDDDECADGLVCSTATERCVEPAGDGENCEGGSEPQCDAGYLCVGADADAGTLGTCRSTDSVVLRGEGAACDPETAELCEDGLSCVVSGLTLEDPTWECRARPAAGGSCGLGIPENCPAGQYCPLTFVELLLGTFESECLPLPQAGEPCAARPLPFLSACEAYARCDGSSCVELRDLGESCEASAVCYSGYCSDGACQSPRACE